MESVKLWLWGKYMICISTVNVSWAPPLRATSVLYIWSLESHRELWLPPSESALCSVTFKLNSCYNILISLTHTQFIIAVLLRNMYYHQSETFWLSCLGWVYPCEYTLCNLFYSLFNRGQLFVLRKWDNELLKDQSTMRLISEWKLSA